MTYSWGNNSRIYKDPLAHHPVPVTPTMNGTNESSSGLLLNIVPTDLILLFAWCTFK